MAAEHAHLSGAARFAEDTRDRFVAEIVRRVPLGALVELHLFAPMRQGGVETGVAVVVAVAVPERTNELAPDAGAACDPTDSAAGPAPAADAAPESGRVRSPRHTILTARYHLALRGPDRGRWTVDVVEEAEAPLVTVEAVVRGVQRRAGDASGADRLDAAAVSVILSRLGPPS